MDNPLSLPKPESEIEQIHHLARDLAYGAVKKRWSAQILVSAMSDGRIVWQSEAADQFNPIFEVYLRNKWQNKQPDEFLMMSFGYFSILEQKPSMTRYMLTDKAFSLLEQPTSEASIFISYRRKHSTAFALLLEARLRLVGNQNVFVDKLLEIGGEWQKELEKRIANCNYFIVLVSEDTFESDWVLKEVELAAEHGATIIPVWDPSGKRDHRTPQTINDRQEIRIELETAEAYETAINKLLHRLGYKTY